MKESDLAPLTCIVCQVPVPSVPEGAVAAGWTYLSGVKPVGAMACSARCTKQAIARFRKTGRVDQPLPEEKG